METPGTVRPAASVEPAQWLMSDALDDWSETVRWGPRGFEVYARVDFDARDGHDDEADPERLLTALLPTLADHTSTPDECFAAVWEGRSGPDTPLLEAPVVDLPERRMFLFEVASRDLRDVPALAWSGDDLVDHGPAPDLAWPADRAWLVAWDVDEALAFTIACSERAYAALTAALPDRVRRAQRGDPEPLYAPGGHGEPIDPRALGEPVPAGDPGFMRYAGLGLLGGFGIGGLSDGG
ncbi:hypothetical protein KLP28_04845 [Nocardioidaceae bacterium]|nr:hypothetical protein KLP28_04845 [Nocardioidaceae bacterium]